MSRDLRGGCSCGRNTYIIEFPPNASDSAQVFFDSGHSHLRSQATPLTAWLRVPLSWYHSTTYAFFNDETHNAIRRVYIPPQEQNSKRHFCGFCGTPLSYWSESPPSEADYISLTLGSLSRDDLDDLEELGLLPLSPKEEIPGANNGRANEEHGRHPEPVLVRRTEVGVRDVVGAGSVPWFESMIHGSNLGRIKRSRGARQTGDGLLRVEWEIVEWTGDEMGDDAPVIGKRKLDAMEGGDLGMSGLH